MDYMFILISCRYALVVNDKNLCSLSILSLITVSYLTETNRSLKSKGSSLVRGLPLSLDVDAFNSFRLTVFAIIYFQQKSIFKSD